LVEGDLGETIDTILRDFVSMLLADEDTRVPRPARKAANKRNHNAVNRFRYARCQEAYCKCPCKLVDMAIAGTNTFPPRIEPLEAAQVRELYEQLWDIAGPYRVLPRRIGVT